MGALLTMTKQAQLRRTRQGFIGAVDLINGHMADLGENVVMPHPPAEMDDDSAAGFHAELTQAYEGIIDAYKYPAVRPVDQVDDFDDSPAAQWRAARALEDASWRRRTGPERWFDRRTERERRAQRMAERVYLFTGGFGFGTAVTWCMVWAVTR